MVSLVAGLLASACATAVTQPSSAPSSSFRPTASHSQSPSDGPTATSGPRTAQPSSSASASPTEAPSPIATPQLTGSPTPTDTSGHSNQTYGLVVKWSEESDPGFGLVYNFIGTASANGTLVAIGTAGGNFDDAAIWFSSDGSYWQKADLPDVDHRADLSSITAGGPGFVVVGYEYGIDDALDHGVAWTSVDGLAWQRIDAPEFVGHPLAFVGNASGTLVAFSREVSWAPGQGALFTSIDGASWSESTDPSAMAIAKGIVTMGGDTSTLWAFSRDQDEPRENQQKLEVWQTADGQTWTQTGTIDGSQGATRAVAGGDDYGQVVIVETNRQETWAWHTWFSTNGSDWLPAIQSPARITDVLADDAGFVAVGHYNSRPGCALNELDEVGVTWTSVDGIRWRQMSERGWRARVVQVVTRVDRMLIGLGVDYRGVSGIEWTDDLPPIVEDQLPPPSPTPEPTPAQGCGP